MHLGPTPPIPLSIAASNSAVSVHHVRNLHMLAVLAELAELAGSVLQQQQQQQHISMCSLLAPRSSLLAPCASLSRAAPPPAYRRDAPSCETVFFFFNHTKSHRTLSPITCSMWGLHLLNGGDGPQFDRTRNHRFVFQKPLVALQHPRGRARHNTAVQ